MGFGDQIRNVTEGLKGKVEEVADKVIDSKLDGEMANKAKSAVEAGLNKADELLDSKLGDKAVDTDGEQSEAK
ncbi:hypothetical protein [Corynebacterium argentoratense]|uniref:hypothetical protein n=1 Tax=Corynebacterium argentoratense TaxID=42817 RepID=UPI002430032F|nr:hypothetical protein [Corynebacterium argentoratense]